MAEEMLTETDVGIPASPVEAGVPEPGAAEAPAGSVLTLTTDDVPELAEMQIGDVMEVRVDDITDDGSYSLSVVAGVAPEPAADIETEAGLVGEPAAPGGRDDVIAALTG